MENYPNGTNVSAITAKLPEGGSNTGENNADNTGSGDGVPDGRLLKSVNLGITSYPNQNLGIAFYPTADPKNFYAANDAFSASPQSS